jgi:hypothetical protein
VFPEDEQELIVGPLSQYIFGVVAFFLISTPAFIANFFEDRDGADNNYSLHNRICADSNRA